MAWGPRGFGVTALVLALGCVPTEKPGGDSGEDALAGTCTPWSDAPVDKLPAQEPRAARTLSGSITTTLDFDAEAEALGYHDCSYTRAYRLLEEVTDQGWLCPECAWLVKGQTEVVDGYDACFLQISDSDAVRVEQLGGVLAGESVHVYRSGLENVPLSDTGAVVARTEVDGGAPFMVSWLDEGELDGGGLLSLSAAGGLVSGISADHLVEDPAAARLTPYTCGWPLQSPGGAVTDWYPTTGGVYPNPRLTDTCGEEVALWDFRGRYVVLDAASPDCGPCNAMADTAAAFEAAMAEECITVATVTLLNLSLSAVNLPADAETVAAWIAEHHLTSPVLADEGFGYDVLAPYVSGLSGDEGMSLPSAVVIAPDGRLVGGEHGYSDEDDGAGRVGWDKYADMIRADLAAHPYP